MQKIIISHLFNDKTNPCYWTIQSNEVHCAGVADLSHTFANEFGMANWGKLIGLLHDRGKEKDDFQNYIKSVSGYYTVPKKWTDKSHSFVGAILMHLKFRDPLKIMPNIIAGHHRGLYDIDELEKLLNKECPREISKEIPDIKIESPKVKLDKSDIHHLTRMLYSCLVDADYLDTERFMNGGCKSERENEYSLIQLKSKLEQHLSSMPCSSHIDRIRKDIQELCIKKSNSENKFFTLTVPTGGGKTLASVLWAINYAINNGKKRIIIAIPFTSIIVQTAQLLRDIFGNYNVIEHHCVVDEKNLSERNKLASENWDAPIVVTTNVQFFESVFSNRPAACRKLHSICNSVVIFDEVQSIPLTFMHPICDSLISYSKLFGTSFLFCTASQPILDGTRKGLGNAVFKGIPHHEIQHIVSDDTLLHEKLRRVKIKFEKMNFKIDELASDLSTLKKVLCVVNTRKLVKDVYDCIPVADVNKFHLSKMMCPAHIKKTIDEIKFKLKQNNDDQIIVVSTQLIEAGVDIDFPIVFRQMAGLDSIIQAAGRCNREGFEKIGLTHVFDFEGFSAKGAMGFSIDAMKSLMNQYPDADWFSPNIMRRYFEILYQKTPSFDSKNISEMYNNSLDIKYEEISNNFNLISDNGMSVVVNYGDSPLLMESLIRHGPSKEIVRKLGLYTVSIHKSLFNDFLKMGIIEEPLDGFYFIKQKKQYDLKTGVKSNNEFLEQTYII